MSLNRPAVEGDSGQYLNPIELCSIGADGNRRRIGDMPGGHTHHDTHATSNDNESTNKKKVYSSNADAYERVSGDITEDDTYNYIGDVHGGGRGDMPSDHTNNHNVDGPETGKESVFSVRMIVIAAVCMLILSMVASTIVVVVYHATIAKSHEMTSQTNTSDSTNRQSALPELVYTLQETVLALQKSHSSSGVAFMAELSADIRNTTQGSVVMFDRVHTNKGNAYNSTRGVFTAPTNGTYYFSVVASTPNKPGGQLRLFVMKSGVKVGYVFLDGNTSYWLRRHTDATIYLVHGEQVWVTIHDFSKSTLAGCCFHTIFSGFIVHTD